MVWEPNRAGHLAIMRIMTAVLLVNVPLINARINDQVFPASTNLFFPLLKTPFCKTPSPEKGLL